MCKVCLVIYPLANKPLSMARISPKVNVPIVPMEVDHLPSALRKIASLLGGVEWTARLGYVGEE